MIRRYALVGIVCVLVAGASFVATVLAQGAKPDAATQPAVLRYLDVTPQQQSDIQKDDPAFAEESASLVEQLRNQRQALAALLESAAPDEQILKQLDATAAAEHALQRRVTEYVLRVRHHLSSEQQLKLMGLCARGIREGGGWRGGEGQRGGKGRGPGPHRGPPQ